MFIHASQKHQLSKIYRKVFPLTIRKSVRLIRDTRSAKQNLYAPGHIFNRFNETKSIFIHIPKTAGLTIVSSLYGDQIIGMGHLDYKKFSKIFGRKKFNNFYKFAFVRNPWDRLYSAYCFLKKGGLNHMDRYFCDNVLNRYSSFEHFVLSWVNKESVQTWIHFRPQHQFVCDKKFNLMVNFVARYEYLSQDYGQICKQISCANKNLMHLNFSSGRNGNYQKIYNATMVQIVEDAYQKDVELFKYNF